MNAPNKLNPALLAICFVVEVLEVKVTERKGEKKDKSGDYHLRLQEVYLHTGHGYPDRFDLNLGKTEDGRDRAPYAPGFYAISPASGKVDKLRLNFGFDVFLVPLPAFVSFDAPEKVKG